MADEDQEDTRGFHWGWFWRTALAVVGLVTMLLGATELGIVVVGEGGRAVLGAGVFLLGLILLAIPVVLGMREAIEAARRGEK